MLGTAAAYIGAIAYSFDNKLDGLGSLKNIPTGNLLVILVGMPLIAAVPAGCWPGASRGHRQAADGVTQRAERPGPGPTGASRTGPAP